MPHARVQKIDASAALKMKGVVAVMTADDLPKIAPPENTILTNEPVYFGQPILAVAATDETTAANAVERIKVDLQPLPFVIDPLESLYPGGPDAQINGNVASNSVKLQTIKWKMQDFAKAGEGQLPMGTPTEEWSYGDLEAGFTGAKVILDECFVDQDAQKAQAAIRIVLSMSSISSQLIDNLNASIHLRTLLTDLFLIDETLKTNYNLIKS